MRWRPFVRGAAIALWLALFARLLREEVFSDAFGAVPDGYRQMLARDVLLKDSWMRVLYKDAPIGFSHSSIELDEKRPEERHVLHNRMHLRVKLLGIEQRIYVDSTARLNDLFDLQSFVFTMSASSYRVRAEGQRAADDAFDVRLNLGAGEQRLRAKLPRDVVLYSPLTETALRRLRPGQSMTLRALDPATLGAVPLAIRAVRRETITVAGREYRATVLETSYMGSTLRAWMAPDGDMLRQETPFGWTLEKAGAEEILAQREQP